MPVRRFRYQCISILDVFDLLPGDRNEVAQLLFYSCEYFGPIKGANCSQGKDGGSQRLPLLMQMARASLTRSTTSPSVT